MAAMAVKRGIAKAEKRIVSGGIGMSEWSMIIQFILFMYVKAPEMCSMYPKTAENGFSYVVRISILIQAKKYSI